MVHDDDTTAVGSNCYNIALMPSVFERLDTLGGIATSYAAARWLDRAAFVFLLLMVAAAPHSIAASQSAWLLGLTATVLRFAFKPRPTFRMTVLPIALVAMFLWAVVSSIFSYEPAISLDKLRGVGLFLVFFFAVLNLRNLSAVRAVVFLLIFSCMFNVVWSLVDRYIGHGIQVFGVAENGALGKAGVIDGDAILTADGQKVKSVDQLLALLDDKGTLKLKVYRPEEYLELVPKKDDISPAAASASESLGIQTWETGRNWRAQGFFSHFTTYAEMLQLIASLLFGLIVVSLGRKRELADSRVSVMRFLTSTSVMIVSLIAMLVVMILTVTRASQGAFLVSAFAIIVLFGSRKLLIAAVIVAIPVILGGMLFLQSSRNIGVIDSKDESTLYRLTMWRDGWRLSHANAHNLIFGIGMDSTKKHWQEWGMFAGGFLPMGHFHSTLMQMLVERGIPGLLVWLSVLGIYAWMLLKAVLEEKRSPSADRWRLGILLGCLGGLIGFFISGIVHYNIGDGEVAMIFYLLMAVGARTVEQTAFPRT